MGHDIYINLDEGHNEIDLIANISIYCRISVFDRYAPMTFDFRYSNQGSSNHNTDIMLFLSASNKQPSKDNCSFKMFKVKIYFLIM